MCVCVCGGGGGGGGGEGGVGGERERGNIFILLNTDTIYIVESTFPYYYT